jgi:translation initiation factor IF-2
VPVRSGGETFAAGSQVISGVVRRGAFVRVVRGRQAVATGQIRVVIVLDKGVLEVEAGKECAISLEPHFDLEPGDLLECFALKDA